MRPTGLEDSGLLARSMFLAVLLDPYAFHVDREKLTTHLVYLHTYLKHQHKLLQHIFCNFLKIKTNIYGFSYMDDIRKWEIQIRNLKCKGKYSYQLNYDHYKNEYICEAKKWHILTCFYLWTVNKCKHMCNSSKVVSHPFIFHLILAPFHEFSLPKLTFNLCVNPFHQRPL